MVTAKENVQTAVKEAVSLAVSGKKWYESKTVWINLIGAAALAIQAKYGFIVPAEYQAGALAGINLILRKLTKTEITF